MKIISEFIFEDVYYWAKIQAVEMSIVKKKESDKFYISFIQKNESIRVTILFENEKEFADFRMSLFTSKPVLE